LKRVGITGGIGSGKSVVGRILEAMNYPVYYSDTESKKIVDTHPEIREKMIKLLGTEIYHEDKLNRPFLTDKLFSDDTIRLKVNEIIHPYVRAAFDHWAHQQNSNLVFNEAAILFETGGYRLMDVNILVTAPIDLKIERVMKRDSCSRQSVLDRMNKQWTDEQKIPLADIVIENDDQQPLLIQVENTVIALKNR